MHIKKKNFYNCLSQKHVYISPKANVSFDSEFEGKNRVAEGSILKDVSLGYGSYCGRDCYFERTQVGRYCSIASRVNIVAGSHPIHTFVSTHPAFFSLQVKDDFGYVGEQKYKELKWADANKKRAVIIGNDVWIGSNATIMEGVTIGDGAVVAANALVTKNVQPYEVVMGIPAKHSDFRFDKEECKKLLSYKWWEKPEQWIVQNAGLFDDIEKFRKLFEK